MTACPTTKPFNRNQGREEKCAAFSPRMVTDHSSLCNHRLWIYISCVHLCPICGKQVWHLSAPACRQSMIPGRLAWLTKATAGHGHKNTYVSRIMLFTTANFILNIAAFRFSGNDRSTFRASVTRLVGTKVVAACQAKPQLPTPPIPSPMANWERRTQPNYAGRQWHGPEGKLNIELRICQRRIPRGSNDRVVILIIK